eukprot:scaffold110844_cov63-Phaeocystis_antarctica.AAC.1
MAQGQGWRMAQGRERQLANRPTSPGAPSTVIAPPTHHSPLVEGAITFSALCAVAGWLVGWLVPPVASGRPMLPGRVCAPLVFTGGSPSTVTAPPTRHHHSHHHNRTRHTNRWTRRPRLTCSSCSASSCRTPRPRPSAPRPRGSRVPWSRLRDGGAAWLHPGPSTPPRRRRPVAARPPGAPEAPRGMPKPPPCVPGACQG